MTHEAYCVLCSGRPPLVFDVAATDRQNTFAVYAYCDCGRIYEHEFVDAAHALSAAPIRFIAKPISATRIQIVNVPKMSDVDRAVPVHEFDLMADDVYCEYHDAADGYDLPVIKQEIVERTAALMSKTTS